MSNSSIRGYAILLTLSICVSIETQLSALNWNFIYNDDSAVSNPPAFDLNGDEIVAMYQQAADIWSDIILDNWTINVELQWKVPIIGGVPNNSYSGQSGLLQSHPDNTNGDPAEQNDRVVWAFSRLNPNRNWWIDPTPTNNSEFDLEQTLFRDLSITQQNGWYFGGNPPDLLEVGYRGDAIPGSGADILLTDSNARDMLSVSVHELGHLVGVGVTQAADDEVSMDGKYDIPTILTGGQEVNALTESFTNDHINPSAISGSPALMCVCSLGGERLLPSAIDVLAGATTANWTNIRLPRTDFLNGTNWNTAGHWEGNRIPDATVDASIRHGGGLSIFFPATAQNLLIDEGSLLANNVALLDVKETTTVGGTPGALSSFSLSGGGSLDTDRLHIRNLGRVTAIAPAAFDVEHLDIDLGGLLVATGTIDLDNPFFGLLVNQGLIQVASPVGLTINSLNAQALNLGGPFK